MINSTFLSAAENIAEKTTGAVKGIGGALSEGAKSVTQPSNEKPSLPNPIEAFKIIASHFASGNPFGLKPSNDRNGAMGEPSSESPKQPSPAEIQEMQKRMQSQQKPKAQD